MPNTIRQKIERFHHFDQSDWRRAVVRAFLVGDPIPGLTERPPGEGVNGGAGYSSTMKILAHLFSVFYAYQYKGGYGGLTLPEIDALVEDATRCFLASIHAAAAATGEPADLSEFPDLAQQFRDLLTNEAKAQAERHRFGHGVVTQGYRDMRDAELDLRRGIGGPPRRKPGRPPEPEDVRLAKERARVEARDKAKAERALGREERVKARAAREAAERARRIAAIQARQAAERAHTIAALHARQEAARAELAAVAAELEALVPAVSAS